MAWQLCRVLPNDPPLYILNADEAFVTGTFAGVIPVIFLDKKMINNGKRGKMTKRLFDLYKSEINKLYPSK